MTGDRTDGRRWPPEENCYCGGPEEIYPHRKGTGRHCRAATEVSVTGDLREALDRETKAASEALEAGEFSTWALRTVKAGELHKQIAERLGWDTSAPADRPPSGLRDQIAEALTEWTLNAAGASRTSPPVHPRTLENLRANSLARADAVLPVIEAAIRRETRASRLLARAEAAERKLQQALDQIATERRGKLAAQAAARRARAAAEDLRHEVGPNHVVTPYVLRILHALDAEGRQDEALDLLREFVDDRPCDPHPGTGFCQTHGEKPPCPHAAAKKLLAALTIKQPKETNR